MNILIFKTVNKERFSKILKNIYKSKNNYYILIPEADKGIYKSNRSNIYYISTDNAFMDYEILRMEKRIPNIKFHEIWVLSSSKDRIYTYTEVYALISELSYHKLIYKIIQENVIIDLDLNVEINFSAIYYNIVRAVRAYTSLCSLFQKKIMGYKW